MTKWLAWAAIAGLATYLTFIGGGWLGIYAAPLRLLTMLAAAAVLGVWLVAAIRSERWRPRSVLMPVIGVALGSLAISTVFSRVPRVSLEYLGYAIVLAALYLLLVRLLAHPFLGRRVLSLTGLYFGVIAGAFLLLVVVHWIDWWGVLNRLALPPLRPNFEGLTYLNPSAVLTMTALFGVTAAALLEPGGRRGRAGLLAIAGIVAIVAFLTGSRAGWLAIALTIPVVLGAALLDRGRRSAIRAALVHWLARGRARATLGAALIVIAVAAVAFAPGIVRRLSEGGEEARAQYAESAVRMWVTSPVVGTGPGTWVIQRLAATNAGEPDVYVPHAHNIEVQTLAELGVLGVFAGVILVLALWRLVAGGFRDPDPIRRRFAWATFVGLAYFGLHQVLDFYANMPAALFAAALPVAYLDATSRPAATRGTAAAAPFARRSAAANRLAAASSVAIVAVALAGLLLQEAPALQAGRAVELADRGEWAAADAPARAAADAEPAIGSYAMTAGLAAARVGDHRAAAAYFERVAARDDLPEAWLNLAAEQVELGLLGEAKESLEHAARVGRQRPAVAMGVADLALRIGTYNVAVEAATSAIAGNPTIASDPWWSTDSVRVAALKYALDVLRATGSDDLRWQIALMVGDVETARSIAAGGPSPEFDLLVIEAWRNQEPFLQQLAPRCYASPLDADALIWCARVAARVGDERWANEMRDLLEVLGPGASNNAGVLRVAPAHDGPFAIAGRHAVNWGTFTYRRATPRDMLVPSIAHLILE